MRKKICLSLLALTFVLSGCSIEKTKPSVEPIEKDTHFMYARENLTKQEKQDYDRVFNIIMTQKKETTIHAENEADILKIYDSVLHDHPEIFWVSEFQYRKADQSKSDMIIYPKYDYSKTKIKEYNEELDIITKQIVKGVDPAASDYEKVKYIFDFVVNQTEYIENAPDSQNVISSLINKASVCAGYAKAIQYLLAELDIECAFITGKAKENNVNHAWNMVNMDGQYYYLDATFADNDDSQNVPLYRYLYFGMSSDDIANLYYEMSAYLETQVSENAFYMVNGNYVTGYDEVKIKELINASIQDGSRNLYLRFDSLDTLNAVNYRLVDEYELFQLLEEKGIVLKNINYYQVPELKSVIYFY